VVAESLLASWRDTPTRASIVAFVDAICDEQADTFLSAAERIAVFDNDGTLWPEKPIPIQLDFTLYRMAELAEADPSLRGRQPYQAAVARDYHWLAGAMVKHYRGDDADLGLLLGAVELAFAGMTVEGFSHEALTWLDGASHPQLQRPYLSCPFVPMVELLRYLEANGFSTSSPRGAIETSCVPSPSSSCTASPPKRVIGSALGLDFVTHPDGSDLLYKSKIEFFDDGAEKPVRIWSRVGRRPLVAGGNSNGDVPMLRFAGPSGRAPLRLLVRHDDPDREFDYVAGAEDALAEADGGAWTVVSVKADWERVFPER
jgi:hypothetical protein